jgi:hypothetical protein
MARVNPQSSGPEFARQFITGAFLVVVEAELVREGLTFTTVDVYTRDVKPTLTGVTASGFTEFDLATLNAFSAAQLAERRWSRSHIVHGPFADYLAAWNGDAARAESPHLTIARFKRTGTYALTVGALVVATAATLDRILPIAARSVREPISIT